MAGQQRFWCPNSYNFVLRFPESGEAPVTGRCCVRHNGDGEKDGDANQVERDVSAVTEG